ncbi:MAG: hypothetical protein K5910_02980 [Bacteroidales bacterium]|nr:hypothetical protein [Bacteroidales bacterium]
MSDLGIRLPFVKGRDIPVRNCWHFSTDGTFAEVLFRDRQDFTDAMNRLYLLARKSPVTILSFCLMDNHIHLILHGILSECNRFVHEYVRQTSLSISRRHGLRKELLTLPVHYQEIDNDFYLKKAICYVHRNPTSANLPYLPTDYPWSSGGLFFRTRGEWNSVTAHPDTVESLSGERRRALFRTREALPDGLSVRADLILPENFVPVELVESLFRTARAYNYLMGSTREEDIESRGGAISRMSLPDAEMRQHRREISQALFGKVSCRDLDTGQRLRLARELRRRYNSSVKQVARLVGLPVGQVEPLLK